MILLGCDSVGQQEPVGEKYTFDQDEPGAVPAGWNADWTGAKSGAVPRWEVRLDDGDRILAQLQSGGGRNDFPVCLKEHSQFENGTVSVRLEPISGEIDQAGGVVFRAADKDNFYVVRANALEDNVSVYYTRDGQRSTIHYWEDVEVQLGAWHTLAVEVSGFKFTVSLDGKFVGEITDSDKVFAGPGMVGVWTKADSVTYFKDLATERE